MHDPTLTMVERYLTLRLACSGPRKEKVRALRRRKSGSAVLKSYSMSCEAIARSSRRLGQTAAAPSG